MVIAGVVFVGYKASKAFKNQSLFTSVSRKKWGKFAAAFVFLWSIVWVVSFLYRSREVTFDCVLDISRNEFLEQQAPIFDEKGNTRIVVTQKASSFQQLEEKYGRPMHSEKNFFNIRYSENDITYFYCPTPFLPIQSTKCLGYRVTVNDNNEVKAMQRRGLSCMNSGRASLVINPINDPIYYFFWSADMWSFQLIPSENYDVERNSFRNF
ncbi:MAG: hypothetical protein ABI425_05300 [Patescibacteria group bacterium]